MELLPSARLGMVGCASPLLSYRARMASAAPELGPFLCELSGMKEAAHRGGLTPLALTMPQSRYFR
jgi:hypothetical protein